MPGFLAHGNGVDDLIIGVTVVAIFVLLSQRKRRRTTGRAGRSAGAGARPPTGTAGSATCLYCDEPVQPTDERCPSCGYTTVDLEER